jgi:hypothetical protein
LITIATMAYGLGPFLTDMNRTHLFHPGWSGHARFHLLWAALSQLAVAGVALWLVWDRTPDALNRCRLAAILGFCMTSGFWGALALKRLYRGTLHDPHGIPPLVPGLDGNVIAVLLIIGLLSVGMWLPAGPERQVDSPFSGTGVFQGRDLRAPVIENSGDSHFPSLRGEERQNHFLFLQRGEPLRDRLDSRLRIGLLGTATRCRQRFWGGLDAIRNDSVQTGL